MFFSDMLQINEEIRKTLKMNIIQYIFKKIRCDTFGHEFEESNDWINMSSNPDYQATIYKCKWCGKEELMLYIGGKKNDRTTHS